MQEFDKQFNKPVETAIAEHPTGTSEAPRIQPTETEIKEPRFSKKQKLIGGLTAAALAAGLVVGLGVSANGEKPAESPASTSEPVDPVEPMPVDPLEPSEPAAPEVEPTSPASIEIPAGLSADEFAQSFIVKSHDLFDSLKTPETNEESLESFGNGVDTQDFVDAKVAELMPKFLQANFTQEFINNPDNAEKIEQLADRFKGELFYWIITHDSGNPEDIEPYTLSRKVESAVETDASNTSRTIEITYTQTDNRDMNRAGTVYAENLTDFSPTKMVVTTLIENGVEKINSYTIDFA